MVMANQPTQPAGEGMADAARLNSVPRINRFSGEGDEEMGLDPRGYWVKFSDVAAIIAERDALRQQAQIHAQEARTANATIAEIYRVCTGGTGEPGNWNGAEPARKLAADRDRLAARCEGLERDAARWNALFMGRVRVLGSAGLHEPPEFYASGWNGYAHIGVELWTKHPEIDDAASREWFTRYADTAIAALSPPASDADGSEPLAAGVAG